MLAGLYAGARESDLAMATLLEGIQLLSAPFTKTPLGVARTMAALVQSYLTQCETSDREPDQKLLGPVLAEFERLNVMEGENERNRR